ncbi:hypothetical protein CE206_29060 (plasmid) [Achromobacter xylosoxidans]|uniref:hypothetical protein n=1 Tax=Alcaligenes xylosoxydans xylosoxydans TaxID=85698 RepID=UPI000DD13277|nr:hypothetical protein [Achromobacter xylosoxidans]AXA80623.1 hypothetical protein CE206_29060 [Achromobacter xylosoxidans]
MNIDSFLDGSLSFTENMLGFIFRGLAVLTGVFFMYRALNLAVADSKGMREGRPLFGPFVAHFMLGFFMLRLAGFSTDVIVLLSGGQPQPPSSALSYLPPQISESNFWRKVALAIAAWVAMFGAIGVYRGLLLWRELADGNPNSNGDLMWRGLWHIVFGGIALNIGGLFSSS